jgi:MFS family permease
VGFILFGTGIALFSYVLEVFGEHTLPLSAILFMILGSAVLLTAYGFHASKTPVPVLNLKLFKIRTFRAAVAGGFVTRLGIGGMPFLLPLLYQIGMGYKPWAAGLLTVPQACAAIGMKVFSRPLLAKFGFRTILISNTVFLGCTIMSFSLINPGAPIYLILCISFAQGFFASLQFTSMNSLIYADIENKDASKASSLGSTAQQMSLSFGVAFSSLVAAWFLGHVDQRLAAQTVPALHKAFLVMGLLTIVSSGTFWSLRPNDGDNVSNRKKEAEKMAGTPALPHPNEAD